MYECLNTEKKKKINRPCATQLKHAIVSYTNENYSVHGAANLCRLCV